MCEEDKQIIKQLGGAGKVSKLVGVSRQRAQNWLTRGIPAKIKIQFPELFLKEVAMKKEKS